MSRTALPRIAAADHHRLHTPWNFDMWIILLEALAALAVLLLIVWWTMFSGRRGGERREDDEGRGN